MKDFDQQSRVEDGVLMLVQYPGLTAEHNYVGIHIESVAGSGTRKSANATLQPEFRSWLRNSLAIFVSISAWRILPPDIAYIRP